MKLIECPRDAWQGLPRLIPTGFKARYLRALISAGFKHIDAVSFVSPKAVPQMSDSEQVLDEIEVPADVEIIGIVVNERGAERAIATGKVTTLGFPCSVSPTFLRRNQNQSIEENLRLLAILREMSSAAGVGIVAYISMAFGNPYDDDWSEARVADLAEAVAGCRADAISLADTVGRADASLISSVTSAVLKRCGAAEVGVHLHSSRASAAGKILAAYDAGCRRFDSAIGGLGGCPFAQDEMIGNIATDAVVDALETRGVVCEMQLTDVAALSGEIAAQFAA